MQVERKTNYMRASFLLLLFAITLSYAKSQVVTDSLLIDNHYRSFHFNQPRQLHKNGSLVFVLHGSGGNGLGMMKSTAKLEAMSESENVLLVYPNGYKNFWNECRKAATSIANIENIDENSFFNGMIEYFEKKYSINSNNVFVVGTSGGGHMAYKLALTMPGKFNAITAIIASLPDSSNMDCLASGVPISVMIINGTEDPLNLYNGGEMKIPGTYLGTVRSTEQTFKYWASLAGYKGNPRKESLPDVDVTDGKTIERYTYRKKRKPEVVLLKVIGGKHDYPNDIDVHVEAWRFFKQRIKR